MQDIRAGQATTLQVTLLLGSNLPFEGLSSRELLEATAVILEGEIGRVVRRSTIIQSEAHGFSGSSFCNQIIVCRTTLAPLSVLEKCEAIERQFGRPAKTYDWRAPRNYADRTLDIDILYYGDLHYSDDRLEIPHPKIAERPFVLSLLDELEK